MTAQYDYSQPHYLVIGPDMAKVDPPDPSDIEQCKQVVRELGFKYVDVFGGGGTRIVRAEFDDVPDVRVFSVQYDAIGAPIREVTQEWFNALFAEELAEQRRSYTRLEHEANRADAERHTV